MNARADTAVSGRLTIRGRLLIAIVPVAVLSILAVAYQADRLAERMVRDQALHRIEVARDTAGAAVERHLDGSVGAVRHLAADARTAAALRDLSQAVRELEDDVYASGATQPDLHGLQARLDRYYGSLVGEQVDVRDLLLVDRPALWLQAHYAAREPTEDAGDGAGELGAFGVAHAEWHPVFVALAAQHGFADLLLVRASDGRIVYSAAKRPDFQTSLLDGPYARSHLGAHFRRLRGRPEPGDVALSDFVSYLPWRNQPAAFAAAPILADGALVGVLAAQIAATDLSRVVSGGGRWDGLGVGGDVFLIGSDGVLRTEPRFALREASLPERRDRKSADNPPSRVAPFEASAARDQLEFAGEYRDARGVLVLGALGPLERHEVRWEVVATLDWREVLGPLTAWRQQLATGAAGLAALLVLVVWAAASWSLHPLRALTAALYGLRGGGLAARVDAAAPGECAALAQGMNGLLEDLAMRGAEDRRRRAADIGELVGAVTALGGAEWSRRVAVNGELADLAAAVNAAGVRIEELVERLRVVPSDIVASAESLLASTEHLRREAVRQTHAATAADTASGDAVRRLGDHATAANAAVQGAADAACAAAAGANRIKADADGLREGAEGSSAVLRRLAEECLDVSLVAGAMSQLSGDLNLLALNAAIEAVRVGTPGAGAVSVADGARRLADRAGGLQHEIGAAVEDLQVAANEAMTASERQSDAVDRHAATAAAVPEQLEGVRAAAARCSRHVAEIAREADGEWYTAVRALHTGAQRFCRAAEIVAREAAALSEAVGQHRTDRARQGGGADAADSPGPEGAVPARAARG